MLQSIGTLRAEVQARQLPLPQTRDLNVRLTSYQVLDDRDLFAIAYYEPRADNRLDSLIVRTYDKRAQQWRAKRFPEPIGSIGSIHRADHYLYVLGHASPSATPLLVLDDRLNLRRTLDGWPKLVSPNGRVLFVRSMVHFAPTHAEALALYDPVTDREWPVYPAADAMNERGWEKVRGTDLWIDRTIHAVSLSGPSGVLMTITEQRMRLDEKQSARPAGAAWKGTILCQLRDPAAVTCSAPLR